MRVYDISLAFVGFHELSWHAPGFHGTDCNGIKNAMHGMAMSMPRGGVMGSLMALPLPSRIMARSYANKNNNLIYNKTLKWWVGGWVGGLGRRVVGLIAFRRLSDCNKIYV